MGGPPLPSVLYTLGFIGQKKKPTRSSLLCRAPSDLQGFGLDSDDIRALRDCKPGKCEIQLPASNAMDELRKSVNWSAPNVNEQVNQLLQKLALSRLQEYQKEGDHIFGPVYNDKGQQVNVADSVRIHAQLLSGVAQGFAGLQQVHPRLSERKNAERAEHLSLGAGELRP